MYLVFPSDDLPFGNTQPKHLNHHMNRAVSQPNIHVDLHHAEISDHTG